MVLGKLPVLGRPTNLFEYSRTGTYCACGRCERGLFGHFFSRLSFLFSFSSCLKEPLSPEQPTKQPNTFKEKVGKPSETDTIKSQISSKNYHEKKDSTKRHHQRHHQRQPGEQLFPIQMVFG